MSNQVYSNETEKYPIDLPANAVTLTGTQVLTNKTISQGRYDNITFLNGVNPTTTIASVATIPRLVLFPDSSGTISINTDTIAQLGTMSGIWAVNPAIIYKLTKINNIVAMSQVSNAIAVANAAGFITLSLPLPLLYRPTDPANLRFSIYVSDNTVVSRGTLQIDTATGVITAYNNINTNFSGVGSSGLLPFTVSWELN